MKVSIEREGSIDAVRAHEYERASVDEAQLPGILNQQVVEGLLVYDFVHPEHL